MLFALNGGVSVHSVAGASYAVVAAKLKLNCCGVFEFDSPVGWRFTIDQQLFKRLRIVPNHPYADFCHRGLRKRRVLVVVFWSRCREVFLEAKAV